jgi:hypothetical protein
MLLNILSMDTNFSSDQPAGRNMRLPPNFVQIIFGQSVGERAPLQVRPGQDTNHQPEATSLAQGRGCGFSCGGARRGRHPGFTLPQINSSNLTMATSGNLLAIYGKQTIRNRAMLGYPNLMPNEKL